MKTIGFIDYYISEWHANNYPNWIKQASEKIGEDFVVKYAWAEQDISPLDGKSTKEWCEEFGIEKCDSIEELCEKADYLLILSPSNPEKHLAYAEKALSYKKNTYIDKTFAPDYQTAKKIFELGEQYGTKFFSSSALRYSTELDELKDIKSMFVQGGGSNIEEYIIHQIEMIVKLLDSKAKKICIEKQGSNQFISRIEFDDKRQATMLFGTFPFAISIEKNDGKGGYKKMESDSFAGLISDILNFYLTGKPSFDTNQTLEVIKIRDGIIKGLKKLGKWIKI